MLKKINNEVNIYEAEKRLNVLYTRVNQPNSLFKQKPSSLEIDMMEKKIENLKLFHGSNVILCKHASYGQFPFQFNDKLKIIMMPYSDGESKVFTYDDIEQVQILPDYVQQEFTQTTARKKGGITRAAVGGALFGPVGAVVGSTTATSKSNSTTTHYSNFTNYKILVWLKNGECYFASNIPSKGFFEKKPPKELLELEFYFNKIINDNASTNQFESEQEEIDINCADSDSNRLTNEDYIKSVELDETKIKKVIKIKTIMKVILYVFVIFIFILTILGFVLLINDFVEWLS